MKQLITFLSVLAIACNSFAQNTGNESGVINCSEFHVTRPVREIFAEHPVNEKKPPKKHESEDREHREPQKFPFSVKDGPQYGNDPKAIQDKMGDVDRKST